MAIRKPLVHAVTNTSAAESPVPTLVDELTAYLAGSYVDWAERHRRPVPMWAWLNVAAHGTRDEVVAAAAGARGAIALPDVLMWRQVESSAAVAVLQAGGDDAESLRRLQLAVLVPLELLLANGWVGRLMPETVALLVADALASRDADAA